MELQIAQAARELSAASNGGTDKRKQKGYHAHARYNAYGARRPSSHAQAGPAESAPGTMTPAAPHMRERFTRKARNAGFPRSRQKPPVRHLNHQVTKGGPCARGGGPLHRRQASAQDEWSLRTRGWSRARGVVTGLGRVVPAQAGGGGPRPHWHYRTVAWWSPRTRGWSRGAKAELRPDRVVPAHAGVVRRATRRTCPRPGSVQARPARGRRPRRSAPTLPTPPTPPPGTRHRSPPGPPRTRRGGGRSGPGRGRGGRRRRG